MSSSVAFAASATPATPYPREWPLDTASGYTVAFDLFPRGHAVLGTTHGRVAVLAPGGETRFSAILDSHAVVQIQVATDGGSIVVATAHKLFLLDASYNITEHALVNASAILAMACTLSTHRVLLAHEDGFVVLHDAATGQPLLQYELPQGVAADCVAVDNNAEVVVLGSRDRIVRVLRHTREEGTTVHELQGHKDDVTAVAITPSAALIVSGDGNGDVLIWCAAGTRIPPPSIPFPSVPHCRPALLPTGISLQRRWSTSLRARITGQSPASFSRAMGTTLLPAASPMAPCASGAFMAAFASRRFAPTPPPFAWPTPRSKLCASPATISCGRTTWSRDHPSLLGTLAAAASMPSS
jgi:hypothetical protein